jgi:hypothetical protein
MSPAAKLGKHPRLLEGFAAKGDETGDADRPLLVALATDWDEATFPQDREEYPLDWFEVLDGQEQKPR